MIQLGLAVATNSIYKVKQIDKIPPGLFVLAGVHRSI